jgi:diadenylate cyclase
MNERIASTLSTFEGMRFNDVLDIILVSVILYNVFLLLHETRALQMLKGFAIIMILVVLSKILKLDTMSWILTALSTIWIIAFIIVFQPELRRALVEFGQNRLFKFIFKEHAQLYRELKETAEILARKKTGALIVLEREVNLKSFIDTGTKIDSETSSELLISLFNTKAPLHDGAVIIREGRIAAAGCILPLSQRDDIDKKYGMRHRAAIGISEETDALTIIVSEERKSISLAIGGKITPDINGETLLEILNGGIMKDFFKILFIKNWQYKLGSLLAALVLWYYVASDQNLSVVINAPVQFSNFPADMKIMNNVKNTIDIQLTGRRDIVNDINNNAITVSLSLKDAHIGKNTYRITPADIKFLPRGLDIKNIRPYSIDVELQNIKQDVK